MMQPLCIIPHKRCSNVIKGFEMSPPTQFRNSSVRLLFCKDTNDWLDNGIFLMKFDSGTDSSLRLFPLQPVTSP